MHVRFGRRSSQGCLDNANDQLTLLPGHIGLIKYLNDLDGWANERRKAKMADYDKVCIY